MGRVARHGQGHLDAQRKSMGAFGVLKGLLSGGLLGVVVGGTGLTVASLVTDQPAGNAPPETPQVSAPATSASEDQTPVLQLDPDVAPTMTAPDVETTSGLEIVNDLGESPETPTPVIADTASAAVPETSEVSDELTAPAEGADLPDDPALEEPVLPNPQSIAPQVPVTEQDVDVSTAPAALPEPIVVAVPEPVEEAVTLDIPVPQPAPVEPAAIIVDDPEPEAPVATVIEDAPVIAAPTGLPAGDASVGRIRLGSDEPETASTSTGSALETYGTAFDQPDGKPLMGVILMDDGNMNGGSAAVASLPFPVTVVLDPAAEGASDRLAAYRAAGIEVGVQSQLPDGATPVDVDVALEATFKALAETVLLLDAGDGGLQNDRAVTAQAMDRLAQDGRGLVTVSKGLNMALRAAEQAEVPARIIFRDLDANGQDARVIRRFLDQAAFRARQNSGVLLLARVRPDTISALVLWGTANRAGQVALAPASAILLGQGE